MLESARESSPCSLDLMLSVSAQGRLCSVCRPMLLISWWWWGRLLAERAAEIGKQVCLKQPPETCKGLKEGVQGRLC